METLPNGERRPRIEQSRLQAEFVKVKGEAVYLHIPFLNKTFAVDKQEFKLSFYPLVRRGENEEEVYQRFSALL